MGLAQVMDQAADFDHLRRVQADGGLVQDDDLGGAQQRPGNTHALAVALGQVADQPPFHLLQAGAGAGVFYSRDAVGLFAGALQLGHKQQVFPHSHILVQRRLLRQIADAGLGGGGFLGNIMAVDGHGAVGGRQVAGDDIHGRRLARAVRPQQAVDAAVLNGKADVIHSGMAAVAFRQMFDLDQNALPFFYAESWT